MQCITALRSQSHVPFSVSKPRFRYRNLSSYIRPGYGLPVHLLLVEFFGAFHYIVIGGRTIVVVVVVYQRARLTQEKFDQSVKISIVQEAGTSEASGARPSGETHPVAPLALLNKQSCMFVCVCARVLETSL